MRIVALQPSISIVLAQLGRLDDLAGCTKWCVDAIPELRKRQVPVVKDSWSSSADEILAIKPDLVIASVPYRLESLAAILKAGAPVLALAPHCLADIYRDICLIGSVVNDQGSAQRLVSEMQAEIECIRQQAFALDRVHAGQRPVVYCEEWGKPLIRSQEWVRELVEVAGGSFQGIPGSIATAAEIADADPEILAMAWCGAGSRVPLRRVVEQRGWQQLRAVRERRVYCIPDELLNTPATNLVDGLKALAAAIHPDYFDYAGMLRLTD